MTKLLERVRPQWWYVISQALYMVVFEVAWAGGNLTLANQPLLAVLGVLSGLLYVVGDSIYIVETAHGHTKPQRISWLIFLVVNACNLANQYASGATNSLWIVAAATLTTAIVSVMSISRGVGGADKLDWAVLAGAGLGLGMWAFLDNPVASTICNVVVATVALVPTAKKVFRDPGSENGLAWLLSALSALVAAASVGAWNFNLLILPIHDFLAEIVIYGLIVYRGSIIKKVGYYDAAGAREAMGRNIKIPGVDFLALLPILALVGVGLGQAAVRMNTVAMMPAPANNPMVLGQTATPTPMATPLLTPTPVPTVAPTPAPRVRAAAPVVTAAPTEIASLAVCPGQNDPAQANSALVCLSAWARTFHGLAGVTANSALTAAAGSKAGDMVNCGFSHTACGRAFDYWITADGFSGQCSAENIAAGQQTPAQVFRGWMQSSGHRANILNGSYRYVGASQLPSSTGPMWVMEFGGC